MTTAANQPEAKKTTAKAAEHHAVSTFEVPKVVNPFEEIQSKARMTYLAYMEAQRDVANAYRLRDQQDQEEFKRFEIEAYKNYERTIEKALRAREKAEQDADAACKEAKMKAAQVYEENAKKALKDCKDTIDEAWKVSRETSEQMWTLFQVDNKV